jgi:omega-amidase
LEVVMQSYRVAAIQFAPKSLDVEANLETMTELLRAAAAQGAKLVVFPELSDTGYVARWPTNRPEMLYANQVYELASPIPGRTTEALGQAAREAGVLVASGLLEADPTIKGRVYNSAVLIDSSGSVVGKHRKVTSPLAEYFYFVRGNRLDVFDTEIGKIGMSVCVDSVFPETVRVQTLRGMEIHIIMWALSKPASPTIQTPVGQLPIGFVAYLPTTIKQLPAVRAVENAVYVISCNCVGYHEFVGASFMGCSSIASPWGEILAEAEGDEETIVMAEIDLDKMGPARAGKVVLKDRRPDLYGMITETP